VVSYRDAVEIAAGDPASIVNPTPNIFYCGLGNGFLFFRLNINAALGKPAPQTSKNIKRKTLEIQTKIRNGSPTLFHFYLLKTAFYSSDFS
jgi:hypothetical protein